MNPEVDPKLVSILRKYLTKHLVSHSLWKGDFFRVSDPNRKEFQGLQSPQEQDPRTVWKMLCVWAENMMAASYGFQTYVLLLASRAEDESVRRALVENAWEELGDVEYPLRSHYQMVCSLSKKLCDVPLVNIAKPRLLPSSVNHIQTHIARCKDAEFLHGLGMIYLIEALTRIEFARVLGAFVRWWVPGTGKDIETFALKGGVAYFTSNIEADLKHQEDVEKMIQISFESMGLDIEDEESLKKPLELIEAGVKESIDLRAGFIQGVYDHVFEQNKDGGDATPQPLGSVSSAQFEVSQFTS